MKYISVVSKLSELFGYKFIPNRTDNTTFVGTLLNQIMFYNNKGDYRSRDFELNRLVFLIQQLENLKTNDIKLFRYFIKELKKQDKQDSYWGIRFEISIASSFVNKNINFRKQERPDFKIDEKIGIECGSVRIRKKNEKSNFDYKISSLFYKKSKNIYNNSSTALFIDFTNVLYNLISKQVKVDTQTIKIATFNSLKSTNFGSAILFFLIHTKDSLQQNYIRIDNENTDLQLKIFLDKYYETGYHYVQGYGTSFES